jgi:amino acid transporter
MDQLLGIAVFALYIVQLILGFITHGLYETNRTHRPMQNWVHMTLGILLLALAWYTARTGIIMFGVKEWGKTLYWVWIGVSAIKSYARRR